MIKMTITTWIALISIYLTLGFIKRSQKQGIDLPDVPSVVIALFISVLWLPIIFAMAVKKFFVWLISEALL
jgi:hypothetical protein